MVNLALVIAAKIQNVILFGLEYYFGDAINGLRPKKRCLKRPTTTAATWCALTPISRISPNVIFCGRSVKTCRPSRVALPGTQGS